MSKARSGDPMDKGTVTITREERWYVARHEESGVASQGKTQPAALANLAEALELHMEEDDTEAVVPDAPWF